MILNNIKNRSYCCGQNKNKVITNMVLTLLYNFQSLLIIVPATLLLPSQP